MNGDENEGATATMEPENEAKGGADEVQDAVNQAAIEANNGGDSEMPEMPEAGVGMAGGSEMTKWLMYAVVLVVVLGVLWYLFLR